MTNGQINGQITNWFENGNKKIEGNAFDGKENGKWISWYSNGNKSSELFFEHGVLKKCTQFDQQGKVIVFEEKYSEGNAFDGKENGKWISWYSNGNKSSELFFEHGVLKKCTQFDQQGKVIVFEEKYSEVCKGIYQQFYFEQLESEDPY